MENRSNSPVNLFLLLLFCVFNVQAATGGLIAAVSSHATHNSRPLIWQNVDSAERDVALCFFSFGQYDFIGLIQDNDSLHVLGGLNSAGFGIVQSGADFNSDTGLLIRQALAVCGRVQDFLQYLEDDTLSIESSVSFACLDKFGECVIVEAPNVVFDTNARDNEANAVSVRADFVFSTTSRGGADFWRYHRAVDLLTQLNHQEKLCAQTVLSTVSRDLHTPVSNPYPLPTQQRYDGAPSGFIPTRYAINQFNTVAGLIIEGIEKNNTSAFPTLWCTLGNPCCSAVIPLWPQTGYVPNALAAPKAFLNAVNISKQDRLFSFRKDKTFLDTALYINERAGFYFQIKDFEQQIFQEKEEKMQKWVNMPLTDALKEASHFQKKTVNMCTKLLR